MGENTYGAGGSDAYMATNMSSMSQDPLRKNAKPNSSSNLNQKKQNAFKKSKYIAAATLALRNNRNFNAPQSLIMDSSREGRSLGDEN